MSADLQFLRAGFIYIKIHPKHRFGALYFDQHISRDGLDSTFKRHNFDGGYRIPSESHVKWRLEKSRCGASGSEGRKSGFQNFIRHDLPSKYTSKSPSLGGLCFDRHICGPSPACTFKRHNFAGGNHIPLVSHVQRDSKCRGVVRPVARALISPDPQLSRAGFT